MSFLQAAMSCADLSVAAASLTNVRARNYLLKRGTGLLKGWSHRYVVISSNFVYIYMHDKVRGLKSSWCERWLLANAAIPITQCCVRSVMLARAVVCRKKSLN